MKLSIRVMRDGQVVKLDDPTVGDVLGRIMHPLSPYPRLSTYANVLGSICFWLTLVSAVIRLVAVHESPAWRLGELAVVALGMFFGIHKVMVEPIAKANEQYREAARIWRENYEKASANTTAAQANYDRLHISYVQITSVACRLWESFQFERHRNDL